MQCEVDPNVWKDNATKVTFVIMRPNGRTKLNLSPFEHYEMHRLAYILPSFQKSKEDRIYDQNIEDLIGNQFTTIDALPSHGVKPTWGFHKVKLRKVETWRHAPGFQL